MAITISRLNIQLSADAKRLGADLKKATGSIGRFGEGVKKTLREAFAVAGGQFIIAGVNRFTAAVKASFQSVDRLAKLSDRAGLPLEDLQAFAGAAARASIDVDDLVDAFKELQIRLGEAQFGEIAALEKLARSNLSVNELVGLDPAEQLIRVLERLERFDPQRRRFLIEEIFGGEAGFRLLSLSSQALRDSLNTTRELGLALTRVEAKKVEDLNDSFQKFNGLISALARRVAAAASPAIQRLVELARRLVTSLSTRFFNDLEVAFSNLAGAAVQLADELPGIVDNLSGILDRVGRLTGAVKDFSSTVTELNTEAPRNPVEEFGRRAGRGFRSLFGLSPDVTGDTGALGDLLGIQFSDPALRRELVNLRKQAAKFGQPRTPKLTGQDTQFRGILSRLGSAVGGAFNEPLASVGRVFRGVGEEFGGELFRQLRITQADFLTAERDRLLAPIEQRDGLPASGFAAAIQRGTVEAEIARLNAQDPVRQLEKRIAERAQAIREQQLEEARKLNQQISRLLGQDFTQLSTVSLP